MEMEEEELTSHLSLLTNWVSPRVEASDGYGRIL